MKCKLEKWEIFYSDSKSGDDCLIDQISIDTENKRYILDVNASYDITEGYNENEELIDNSIYISRQIFDMIIEGVKNRGFGEYKE